MPTAAHDCLTEPSPTIACPPVRQGVACLGLGAPEVSSLLVDITNLAAFDSLVAGMLPPMSRRALDNLLASFGWVGGWVEGWALLVLTKRTRLHQECSWERCHNDWCSGSTR